MTREVRICTPGQTIREVARTMGEIAAGARPVGENDRLIGMITDRDIAVRGIGRGKGPDTPVREIMSEHVEYCYDDEDLERVAQGMASVRVRRLPVVNREKRLVGILSLGDVARSQSPREVVAEAVAEVSTPGGPHRQAAQH
jgi:CBS domain-containing protein